MTVRAKFYCHHIAPGATGRGISLGPVYEGSNELQKISENAIFGDATPGGSLHLAGPHLEHFQEGEEYYIDLFQPGEAPAVDGHVVTHCSVVKVFRSAPRRPDQEWPKTDELRFVARAGSGWDLTLAMSIANPAAVAYLDQHEAFDITIRLAVGNRRSDAEIALREQMLDLAKKTVEMNPGTDEVHRASQQRHIASLERKLARAKGEAV